MITTADIVIGTAALVAVGAAAGVWTRYRQEPRREPFDHLLHLADKIAGSVSEHWKPPSGMTLLSWERALKAERRDVIERGRGDQLVAGLNALDEICKILELLREHHHSALRTPKWAAQALRVNAEIVKAAFTGSSGRVA